ncbi:MAG: protein kinase [Prevotella sp.]|nr:protein kinase [Prevotella sp.]
MQHLQSNTTLQGGKYRIERVLGQGGFGNTYMGYNTEFEETVAIKEFFMKGVTERDEMTSVVSVSNADNVQQFEEQREKFKKEARRLRKLKNEHIVKVHDLFEENGTAYYVMDYIDGESLAEKMKKTDQQFTEVEVKSILSQVLEALKEVHQNEIWHLDLKPGNIMIDKSGNAYLIDFGASKQIRANGSMTTSTALCYTPGYAPNEQIGQMYDRFGPWTDIYALGATIYNLLTNKKPPMAIDIEEDEEGAFDFSNSISEDMRKLVVWMMQPKRKKRPQSVDEILSLLNNKQSVTPQVITSPLTDKEETVLKESIPDDNEETILATNGVQKYGKMQSVDLGLSVLWADCNVGGDSESPIGGLYGWADPSGEKTSQNIRDYLDIAGGMYVKTPQNISGTQYDIATVKWGQGWKMPSKENWKELVDKCKWTKEKAFHVSGYRVEGPNGNSIFLPNTGLRFGETISNTDAGYYWTSEMAQNDRECACYYYFDGDKHNDIVTTRNYVYSGRAVRPVMDKQ